MGTKRLLMRGVLSLSLVAMLSSYGLAAERGNMLNEHANGGAKVGMLPESSAPDSHALDVVRASRVIGALVKSPQGETLGRVHDIVLTPDLDKISYVVLSRGGILGLGNTLYAIPWSALSRGVNDIYVVSITKEQFDQNRGFRQAYWPSSAERGWLVVEDQEPIYQGETAQESRNVQDRRFTRIKGTDVIGSQQRDVGNIQDLVIALDTGDIAYTIVSYGGLFGLGHRFAAIPQNAITLEPSLDVAHVEATRETVQANSFPPEQWPALASPSTSRQLARAYGVEAASEGTVLGFVAPEEPATAAPAPRPGAQPARPSVSGTTPAPGAQAMTTMPAPTEAELTGTFDPARVRTIEGTVTELGKIRSATLGHDLLWLRVRTNEGQTYLVNLGPRSYVSKQDIYVVRDDQIRLTGSAIQTTALGKHVFLPTEITHENYVLRLRSANGNPLWDQPMREGQQPGRTSQAPADSPPQARDQMTTPDRDEDVLGYVPAEGRPANERARPGEAAREPTTTQRSYAPVPFPSVDAQAIDAFDLTNMRTMEGTVTEIGKSRPAVAGGPDIVWLRIKTADDQLINVQVGPRDFVSKQDFFVLGGDRVRMTGWELHATPETGRMPVFILADIAQNGHLLQLRSRNGQPLWITQPGAPGQPAQSPSQSRPTTPTPDETDEADTTDEEDGMPTPS